MNIQWNTLTNIHTCQSRTFYYMKTDYTFILLLACITTFREKASATCFSHLSRFQ